VLHLQDRRLAFDAAKAQVTAAESDPAFARLALDSSVDLSAKGFIIGAVSESVEDLGTAARARVDQARTMNRRNWVEREPCESFTTRRNC